MTSADALVEALRTFVSEELDARLALAPPPVTEREWFTIPQAADYLCISERQMKRLVGDGDVRSSILGRRRIIRREWLDEYATAREDVTPITPPRRRSALPYALPITQDGGRHAAR